MYEKKINHLIKDMYFFKLPSFLIIDIYVIVGKNFILVLFYFYFILGVTLLLLSKQLYSSFVIVYAETCNGTLKNKHD